ncbi:MAG: glycoside hydrolase family 15 protein, partial [Candidatus Binataceae bacterium]
EFENAQGVAAVIDFMPMPHEDGLVDLVRIVEGRRGAVRMSMKLIFRFDYGDVVPWVVRREYGIRATAGPDSAILRTPVRLRGQEDFSHTAEFTVNEGQRIPFTLTWFRSHRPEPNHRHPMRELEQTEKTWTEWSSHCTYQGPWRQQVLRSLITLKALTDGATGGIVAAPTTSLPEWIGGVRNWDYRFCWLRDATFTLYALMSSGYTDEAREWREWLLRSVAGQPQKLQIMYGIAGERRLTEMEIPWLAGYGESQPVRVGNAAHGQFQLDVYGEVMDSLYLARKHAIQHEGEAWNVQLAIMDFLETGWEQPDEGIWEVRGPRQNFTHSKVMAWVAFDRAIKAVEKFGLEGPIEKWRVLRDKIRADVLARGFSKDRNAFVQHYDSDEMDAALLMIPLVGFLPATDPRMLSTIDAIQRELLRDGFVQRYANHDQVDGLPKGEGVFLPCSFWLADNLMLTGREEEARTLYEKLLGLCNDVGLLAEEYDPEGRRQLGNFPQAFTHVSLVNTAMNLTRRRGPAITRADH